MESGEETGVLKHVRFKKKPENRYRSNRGVKSKGDADWEYYYRDWAWQKVILQAGQRILLNCIK